MSTNPFDDDHDGGVPPPSSSRPPPDGGIGRSSAPPPQQQRPHRKRATSRHGFDDEEPIWAARNVEWPIPSSLSPSVLSKLHKQSRREGNLAGIVVDASMGVGSYGVGVGGGVGGVGEEDEDDGREGGGYYSTGIAGLMSRVIGTSGGTGGGSAADEQTAEDDVLSSATSHPIRPPRNRAVAASNGWIVASLEVPPSTTHLSSASTAAGAGGGTAGTAPGGTLTPPPPLRLVSRWNVRRGSSSSSSTSGSSSGGENLIPLPPPAPRTNNQTDPQNTFNTATNSSRIAHVFVDPTGCHTFLSARNGEAYHLHSSSRRVRKLVGFGPNGDGNLSYTPGYPSSEVTTTNNYNVQLGLTPGSYVTAIGWDCDRGTEGTTKCILLGTSLGEVYEFGLVSPSFAEGDEKGVVLRETSSGSGGDGTGGGNEYGEGSMPVLLHRLNVSAEGRSSGGGGMGGGGGGIGGVGGGDGAAVTGIHFERMSKAPAGATIPNSTGMIVLAATSGPNKRTRLHTYRSNTAISFRSVFAQSSSSSSGDKDTGGGAAASSLSHSSFVELPGSIDFADLRLCNDHFALRTETGIYYGTIDRGTGTAGTDKAFPAHGPAGAIGMGGGVVDAGILPYDDDSLAVTVGHSSNHNAQIPASIAITPHHFITLSDTNQVRFINRVAKKVIQKERVDWVVTSNQGSAGGGPPGSVGPTSQAAMAGLTSSSAAVGAAMHHEQHDGSLLGSGELLMDIRRPDQIWLRKSRALVHISSSCEDRDVWKFTLERCLDQLPRGSSSKGSSAVLDHRRSVASPSSSSSALTTIPPLTPEEKTQDSRFEHAKSLCANTTQKAVVTASRAEFHLVQGRVELAAKYLAQCPPTLAPFADTSIRLSLPMLGIDDPKSYGYSDVAQNNLTRSNMALITYLTDRMRAAKMREDKVACAMIGSWLCELHLHERERGLESHSTFPLVKGGGSSVRDMNEQRLSSSRRLQQTSDSKTTSPSAETKQSQPQQQQQTNYALLHQFLSSNVRVMDASTIVRILSSHDVGATECAGYAAASGDIGTAVNAALCGAADDKSGALDALRVLNDAPLEQSEPFYYRHASTLLSRAPMASSKSFLARFQQGLSATRLLPAFMHYERRRAEVRSLARREMERGGGGGTSRSEGGHPGGGSSRHERKGSHLENVHVEGSRSFDDGVEVRIGGHGGVGGAVATPQLPHAASFVDDENASIKYLEGVIKLGCTSTAIYNYLISLYANMEDEGPLFRFLATHVPSNAAPAAPAGSVSAGGSGGGGIAEAMLQRQDPSSSFPLDMSYALRVILRTGRHFRSAVKVYMGFGMRQQAVELALKVDPALARELAKKSVGDDERKRLWLMIARNAAADTENRGGRDVVSKVVSVLRDCPDVLSIEDVLPFLPDFAQIDEFKDEICGALTSYSSKIDQYLKEMNECDVTCDTLREEISRLGTHGMQMKADARCAFTRKFVVNENEPFYVFPSGYVALESALKREVVPYLNKKQRDRVESVEKELSRLLATAAGGGQKSGGASRVPSDPSEEEAYLDRTMRVEELQSELDGLIAAECPLTGTIMVDSIDRPFPDDMDEEEPFNATGDGRWFGQPSV